MGVSRSGYYEWLNRKPSLRNIENKKLKEAIKATHKMSREIYGYRRIHADIKAQNQTCSLNRINQLMREKGIRAKTRREFKATTDSNHNLPINSNVIERDFTALSPNNKWVTDITYIATEEGWLYLVVIIDLFSRKVVG